jgi:hypothetical protein
MRSLRSGSRIIFAAMVISVMVGLWEKPAAAETKPALIKGKIDFSDGLKGWWWPGLGAGKSSPGELDGDTFQSPPYSFSMEGGKGEKLISRTIANVEPGKVYRLSAYIKTEGVKPENVVIVYLQQWSAANKPLRFAYKEGEQGVWQLIRTGGTHGWKKFEVKVNVWEPEARRLTVYLKLEGDSKGKVWFDDIVLEELPQNEVQSRLNKKAPAKLKTFYYPTAKDPAVLEPDKNPGLALRVEGDIKGNSRLFFTDEEVKIDIEVAKDNLPQKGADSVSYRIKDYLGRELA